MPHSPALRNLATALAALFTLPGALLLALPAAAQSSAQSVHPCAADSGSLSCRLDQILHWLEATAGFLALVLVAVLVLAVHLYRRNRASRPDGRSPRA